jgi:pSer/pThr/pTyr-binding forkhead associated (FHA) protein
VDADPKYHAELDSWALPGAERTPFPVYCPRRTFVLRGDQLLIGRRSPGSGAIPDIDLSGPPEDLRVSPVHALLLSGPDGEWSIVDLQSAKGTYLNGVNPIPHSVVTRLGDGDRIHLGAWTTLTLRHVEGPR